MINSQNRPFKRNALWIWLSFRLPTVYYFILCQLAAANNWTDLQKFASKRKLARHAIQCAATFFGKGIFIISVNSYAWINGTYFFNFISMVKTLSKLDLGAYLGTYLGRYCKLNSWKKRNCIALDSSPMFLHRGTCSLRERDVFRVFSGRVVAGRRRRAGRRGAGRCAAQRHLSAGPRRQVRAARAAAAARPPSVRRHAPSRTHVLAARIPTHTRRARFE